MTNIQGSVQACPPRHARGTHKPLSSAQSRAQECESPPGKRQYKMNRLLTKMSTPTRTVAVLAAVSLSLSACGAKVSDAATGGAKGSAAKCGTFNLAVNAWVGYAANAAVVAYLAHNKLGCTVKLQNLDEQISWQGFASGQVD